MSEELDTGTERGVKVGDIVVFSRDGRTEATVTKTFGTSGFIVEWEQNGERRGQAFRERVFETAPYVDHDPAPRVEQATLMEAAE